MIVRLITSHGNSNQSKFEKHIYFLASQRWRHIRKQFDAAAQLSILIAENIKYKPNFVCMRATL